IRVLFFYHVPSLVTPRFIVFFFSSRRRHTRSKRDWSSDVCSSDLGQCQVDGTIRALTQEVNVAIQQEVRRIAEGIAHSFACQVRSEERRVGKECRSQREKDNDKKKTEGNIEGIKKKGTDQVSIQRN